MWRLQICFLFFAERITTTTVHHNQMLLQDVNNLKIYIL